MNPRFKIGQLLSPAFSKSIEDNSNSIIPSASLPTNIFDIKVEEFLANYNNFQEQTTASSSTTMPFKSVDDNRLNTRMVRQALGLKNTINNNQMSNYTNSYQNNSESYRKNANSNTTKFGFSKH